MIYELALCKMKDRRLFDALEHRKILEPFEETIRGNCLPEKLVKGLS